jgi:A/G-specific adenine glycosylase
VENRGCNAEEAAGGVTHTAGMARPARGSLDAAALAAFFRREGRDLPWRRPEAGPWGVLVSEVMLQQTPVARVLPVYLEWMTRWPTPDALAAAETAEVIRAWGRLGYPRRALRLQQAAGVISRHHDGAVPQHLGELLALPGVGEYTARAVAAFAFGQRHPVVDTNIRRVISRAGRGFDEHGPATAADRANLEALLPIAPSEAAAACAALMELGALVCAVDSPDCARCPLADSCAWRAAGFPEGPPRKRPAQRWHGTDRQVRGQIMAVLRGAEDPIAEAELATRTPSYAIDPAQWSRCLVSLLADGLADRDITGALRLPAGSRTTPGSGLSSR